MYRQCKTPVYPDSISSNEQTQYSDGEGTCSNSVTRTAIGTITP